MSQNEKVNNSINERAAVCSFYSYNTESIVI